MRAVIEKTARRLVMAKVYYEEKGLWGRDVVCGLFQYSESLRDLLSWAVACSAFLVSYFAPQLPVLRWARLKGDGFPRLEGT